MFTKKELEHTSKTAEVKTNKILRSKEGSDLDYITNLQTLAKLKNASDEKLDKKDHLA